MELREALKVEAADTFKSVVPLNISHFFLFDKQIEEISFKQNKADYQWQPKLL